MIVQEKCSDDPIIYYWVSETSHILLGVSPGVSHFENNSIEHRYIISTKRSIVKEMWCQNTIPVDN